MSDLDLDFNVGDRVRVLKTGEVFTIDVACPAMAGTSDALYSTGVGDPVYGAEEIELVEEDPK